MYSAVIEWNILWVSVGVVNSILYKPSSFLLICFPLVSVTESEMLKPPNGMTKLFISSFNSVHFCFMYLESMYVFINVYLLD